MRGSVFLFCRLVCCPNPCSHLQVLSLHSQSSSTAQFLIPFHPVLHIFYWSKLTTGSPYPADSMPSHPTCILCSAQLETALWETESLRRLMDDYVPRKYERTHLHVCQNCVKLQPQTCAHPLIILCRHTLRVHALLWGCVLYVVLAAEEGEEGLLLLRCWVGGGGGRASGGLR